MRVSKGALVAGGVGIAAAGTLVARRRASRNRRKQAPSVVPSQAVAGQPDAGSGATMTVIKEKEPGDLAESA